MARIISFDKKENFKKGYVTLIGRTGKHYRNLALEVPGYGMVPCSVNLQNNFTTNSENLLLIVSESTDEYIPYTSDKWITLDTREIIAVF